MDKADHLYQTIAAIATRLLPLPLARIAVAVSGGSDSMALVLLAKRWAMAHQVELVALTVDHALRSESAQEAKQVGQWMERHGISHAILTWSQDIPTANLQHEARTMRYQLLAEYCTTHDISCLWLAHHAQDQAETVISRLIRGSGIDGLAAMQPVTYQGKLMLYRPLLSCRPDALRAMLLEQGQDWIQDPSNDNIQFERVRIRNWLDDMPDKDNLIKRLSQTAEHMARARDFIEEEVDHAFAHMVVVKPEGYARLDHTAFNTLHPELALRVMVRIIHTVSGKIYKPRFDALEALYTALHSPAYTGATLGSCQWSKPKDGYIIIRPEGR